MTTRVTVIGPESSGKTTLAQALAARFAAPWVPEAARRYAESGVALSAATVEPIARLAMALEDEVAPGATLVIRDTDLLSTVVYARHYYGASPPWIETEAFARRGDLYLLCLPDLPWTADGIRDRPSAREALLADFRDALSALNARVEEISGLGAAREARAAAAIETLLGERR